MSFNKLPQRTGWVGCKPVELVEKNFQILTEYSLKSKESKNKTMHNSELRWGRND